MFLYPGNLKEKKMFFLLTVTDFTIFGCLALFFIIYSIENYSFIPLAIPIVYLILKIHILENSGSLYDQIIIAFNYILDSQQTYYWGIKEEK